MADGNGSDLDAEEARAKDEDDAADSGNYNLDMQMADIRFSWDAQFCQHGEGGQPIRSMLTSAVWADRRLYFAND